MTRANINFIYYDKKAKDYKVLFHYHNGDQYPDGLRDIYNVIDFIKSDWSEKTFSDWIAKNYTEKDFVKTTYINGLSIESQEDSKRPAKPKKINQPNIYYTGGFITDYSYIFDNEREKNIIIYKWSDKIFEGTAEEAIKWFNNYK